MEICERPQRRGIAVVEAICSMYISEANHLKTTLGFLRRSLVSRRDWDARAGPDLTRRPSAKSHYQFLVALRHINSKAICLKHLSTARNLGFVSVQSWHRPLC